MILGCKDLIWCACVLQSFMDDCTCQTLWIQRWLWLVLVFVVLCSPLERDNHVLKSSGNREKRYKRRASQAHNNRSNQGLKAQSLQRQAWEEKRTRCMHVCACTWVPGSLCQCSKSGARLYLRICAHFYAFTFLFLVLCFSSFSSRVLFEKC